MSRAPGAGLKAGAGLGTGVAPEPAAIRLGRAALLAGLVVLIAIPAVAHWHAFIEPQQRGHAAVALFFGYTHCTDVCPTTMAHLAQAQRALGASAPSVRIVFVTVDRARDTAPVLKHYVSLFSSDAVGLTGAATTLAPVYRDYHVWVEIPPHAEGTGDYEVSHSSAISLIDRSGRLRAPADATDSVGELERKLKALDS